MATYNKPGVYVEESLSPNLPVAVTTAPSVAAFIGYADKGPTSGTAGSNNVVGTPTLITSWSDFINNFSFGSNTNVFSGVPAITLSGATATASTAVTITSGNAQLVSVGALVTGAASLGIPAGTVVTAIGGANSLTLNNAVTLSSATISAAPNSDLKYAVKSFFDNGGAQAYVLRDVNKNADYASTTLKDNSAVTSVALSTSSTMVFDGTATPFAAGKLTITAPAGTFSNFLAGKAVSFSGVTGAYSGLNGKSWVITDVASSTVASISYTPSAVATQTATVSTGTVVLSGGKAGANDTLTVTAKNAGGWGNNVWVGVYPNSRSGYFDLHVYYSPSASAYTSLTDSNRVEKFIGLNMDPTSSQYAPTAVNSQWVVLTDSNSPATGASRLPLFTGSWGSTAGSSNLNSDGSWVWNSAGFSTYTTSSAATNPASLRLGIGANAGSFNNSVNVGTDGSTANIDGTGTRLNAATNAARFDAVATPLIINWAAANDDATIEALTLYAAGRGDSFVIIDAPNTSVTSSLSTVTQYTQAPKFGAAYFPYIVIADPASSTGATKSIAPGGAVAAIYVSTDNKRGVFKAPAGSTSVIRNAVSVPAVANSDFNLITAQNNVLNIIRFVPGSGICVMGARTLSPEYIDKYVPVRRTLNYLGSNLKNITAFAVFEPNDQNLWNNVTSVVSNYLNDFWRKGGLAGATASAAYYVKCDASINPSNVTSIGELHIEVGVALQKPAEFVVIRIGQLDGGATVTTSV